MPLGKSSLNPCQLLSYMTTWPDSNKYRELPGKRDRFDLGTGETIEGDALR